MLSISNDFKQTNLINSPMDLSIILNRLYLDYYKTYHQVWQDINLFFEQVETYYDRQSTDVIILTRRLKRVAIHLYKLWHQNASKIYRKTNQIDIQSKPNTERLIYIYTFTPLLTVIYICTITVIVIRLRQLLIGRIGPEYYF